MGESNNALGTVYDEGAVARVLERVVAVGGELTFPVAPLPVIIPPPLVEEMLGATRLFLDHINQPGFRERSESWVPPGHRAAGALERVPVFNLFDFAITTDSEGRLRPHLIECQGCSSLMGFIPFYGELLAEALAPDHTSLLSHGSLEEYVEDLRNTLGEACWLVDVDTPNQRLRADFWILRHLCGIEVMDLTPELVRRAKDEQPRLYNRIVAPEARRAGLLHVMQDLFGEEQRWVAHPDWYHALSKRTLPELSKLSSVVPETALVTPESVRQWSGRQGVVLKPSDDFGGQGVILEPSAEDLRRALAASEPYMLQRRIPVEPLFTAPDGQRFFCELRVLSLVDRPVGFFCRVAQDPVVSIGRNSGFQWCGITSGLMQKN